MKDFFQYIHRQREQIIPFIAFVENYLFNMSITQYSLQKYIELLSAAGSASPLLLGQMYADTHKELSSFKRVIPQVFTQSLIELGFRIVSLTKLQAIQVLYFKKYDYPLFKSILHTLYSHFFTLQLFQSQYVRMFGFVDYFQKYVTVLINICMLETYVHNSSYALQNLHQTSNFATVTELYYEASKNNGIESHSIYAEYYATLANKYIRLKDFESFMECWQKLLYLRVFEIKCKKRMHQCTSIQRGLAAFGTGKYRQAISLLYPHVYSRKIPLHKRARLFVLVHNSHLKLNELEIARQQLSHDFSLDVVFLHGHVPCTSNNCNFHERDFTILPFQNSTTGELLGVRLGVTDDLYHNSRKNCRALMIFGTFLEKHAITEEMRMFGIRLQDYATLFVRTHSRLFFTHVRRNGNLISKA